MCDKNEVESNGNISKDTSVIESDDTSSVIIRESIVESADFVCMGGLPEIHSIHIFSNANNYKFLLKESSPPFHEGDSIFIDSYKRIPEERKYEMVRENERVVIDRYNFPVLLDLSTINNYSLTELNETYAQGEQKLRKAFEGLTINTAKREYEVRSVDGLEYLETRFYCNVDYPSNCYCKLYKVRITCMDGTRKILFASIKANNVVRIKNQVKVLNRNINRGYAYDENTFTFDFGNSIEEAIYRTNETYNMNSIVLHRKVRSR